MRYIDRNIDVEEFFNIYTKEKIISYIEDLYYIYDCLELEKLLIS